MKELEKGQATIRNLRLVVIILAVFILMFSSRMFVTPQNVIGDSMNPTYTNGQTLWAWNRNLVDVSTGDVVIFKNEHTNNETYIKRVEGCPGDTLYIQEGVLYRNDMPINEHFDLIENAGMLVEPYTLEENEYFVMGDNRNHSKDSRMIGPVLLDQIRFVLIK